MKAIDLFSFQLSPLELKLALLRQERFESDFVLLELNDGEILPLAARTLPVPLPSVRSPKASEDVAAADWRWSRRSLLKEIDCGSDQDFPPSCIS